MLSEVATSQPQRSQPGRENENPGQAVWPARGECYSNDAVLTCAVLQNVKPLLGLLRNRSSCWFHVMLRFSRALHPRAGSDAKRQNQLRVVFKCGCRPPSAFEDNCRWRPRQGFCTKLNEKTEYTPQSVAGPRTANGRGRAITTTAPLPLSPSICRFHPDLTEADDALRVVPLQGKGPLTQLPS